MASGCMRATLEIYKVRQRDGTKKPRTRYQWRLVANNGENLARGSQARGFATVRSCWRNASLTALALAGTYGDLLPWSCPAAGQTVVRKHPTMGHELTITRTA